MAKQEQLVLTIGGEPLRNRKGEIIYLKPVSIPRTISWTLETKKENYVAVYKVPKKWNGKDKLKMTKRYVTDK